MSTWADGIGEGIDVLIKFGTCGCVAGVIFFCTTIIFFVLWVAG